MEPPLGRDDYRRAFEPIWSILVEEQLSFVIKDGRDRTVGICLNFDSHNEPEAAMSGGMAYIFELLDSVERPLL